MTAQSATILEGIISGPLGGGLAVIGAIFAVRKGVRDLENTEIRRQRVNCIINIYGLRFILGLPGGGVRPEDSCAFMFELNKAGVLFADTPSILNDLRDFHDAIKKPNVNLEDRLVWVDQENGCNDEAPY